MEIDDGKNPTPPRNAFESAIEALERSLRADGSRDGGIPEGEHAAYQWRALFRWAEQDGLLFSPEIKPARQGGREHDVSYLPEAGRWLKFTKPDGCGLTVEISDSHAILIPATPLQYLQRIQMQNKFWGDETELVGIQSQTPGARIVISQPDAAGEAPSAASLDDYIRLDCGFERLLIPPMGYYKSACYLFRDIGMFDVHPANFVKTSKGGIVPIDVIMIQFTGSDLKFFRDRVDK